MIKLIKLIDKRSQYRVYSYSKEAILLDDMIFNVYTNTRNYVIKVRLLKIIDKKFAQIKGNYAIKVYL